MAGIKLQIDLPKMGSSTAGLSRLVKEMNNKPRATVKTREVVKKVKVRDRAAEAKVSLLQEKLRKARTELAAEKTKKPRIRTVTKTRVVKEKGNTSNLERQLRDLKSSMPTTSHIGGNV